MKRKIVIFCFLSIFVMLSMPMLSSIQIQPHKNKNKNNLSIVDDPLADPLFRVKVKGYISPEITKYEYETGPRVSYNPWYNITVTKSGLWVFCEPMSVITVFLPGIFFYPYEELKEGYTLKVPGFLFKGLDFNGDDEIYIISQVWKTIPDNP